jgi:predicted CoA-binding protein
MLPLDITSEERAVDWKSNLIESNPGVLEILRQTKSIAVLGIKPESRAGEPAFYVPQYMAQRDYDVIPVPVYYPDVTEILGRPVFRRLVGIGRPIDMVNVFRRSHDIPPHVDDILAAQPRFVWFQLGIRNDEAAETLARAGIKVVQDRCLMVEQGRL